MRIESNSTALVYGNNYQPKSQDQAKEDLPELKKQLASQEENLSSLLKQLEGFDKSHPLVSSTTGLGKHFDGEA